MKEFLDNSNLNNAEETGSRIGRCGHDFGGHHWYHSSGGFCKTTSKVSSTNYDVKNPNFDLKFSDVEFFETLAAIFQKSQFPSVSQKLLQIIVRVAKIYNFATKHNFKFPTKL